MCLPLRTADSMWMLSGSKPGPAFSSRAFQICFRIGGIAYCRGFRDSVDTDYEFGPFREEELASVQIDLWRMAEGVLATDCVGAHCSAATQGRILLAGSSEHPIDLRPPKDVHASSTVIVPMVSDGRQTGFEVRARVELTQ